MAFSFSVPVRSYSFTARVPVVFPVMMDMLTAMLPPGCSGAANSSEESHAGMPVSSNTHVTAFTMRMVRSVVMSFILIIYLYYPFLLSLFV